MEIPKDLLIETIGEKCYNVDTFHDKQEKDKKNDEIRREILFSWFLEQTKREMTETEYQRYLVDFEQAKKGFSIFEWIKTNNLA